MVYSPKQIAEEPSDDGPSFQTVQAVHGDQPGSAGSCRQLLSPARGLPGLSFVRELVRDRYEEGGRPSIDPVVFFKLHLIAFFEGITSERRLMEAAAMNLAHHWYLGYDLDELLPDHSSLSKIRSRYGVEAFQRFFERIVELCME